MNLRTLASLLVAVAALAAPSLASGASTFVGSVEGDPTAAACASPCSRFGTEAVTAAGVLTEVTIRHSGSSAPVSVGPVRNVGGNTWARVEETSATLDEACEGAENDTIEVRDRVQAGDRVAVHLAEAAGSECPGADFSFAEPGGTLWQRLDTDGGVYEQVDDASVLILARIESDNDGDDFGDDTQDTDDDNDGRPDTADNCALSPNTEQANNDGDAAGDLCDADDDNDGTPDATDNCPRNANADQRNTDNSADGGDACDADDDNDDAADGDDDFPLDANESRDLDRDGVGDNADTDDDADGLFDTVEAAIGTDARRADTDSDGLPDGTERRVGSDPLRADTDGDSRLDGADACPTLSAVSTNGCPGGAPGLTTPSLTTSPSEARRLDGLSLRVRLGRVREGRRRMRVTGALDRPAGVGTDACAGRVRLTVRGAGRRLLSKRAPIRGGDCSYGVTLTLPRFATRLSRVTVYVAFQGNTQLLPAEGQRQTVTFR
jgi:Thrombospondin type 3 repeat